MYKHSIRISYQDLTSSLKTKTAQGQGLHAVLSCGQEQVRLSRALPSLCRGGTQSTAPAASRGHYSHTSWSAEPAAWGQCHTPRSCGEARPQLRQQQPGPKQLPCTCRRGRLRAASGTGAAAGCITLSSAVSPGWKSFSSWPASSMLKIKYLPSPCWSAGGTIYNLTNKLSAASGLC